MDARSRSTDGSWSPGCLFFGGRLPEPRNGSCRQAGERLGTAEAHRQLEDLQRIEEFECRSLAADDVERECGARAGALPLEQTTGRGVLVKVSKVVDLGHFGMVKQVIRHE